MLDTESEQWLDTHMERAERFVYFFYATAALATAALALSSKSPKARTVLSALTLAVGLGSLGLGGWISRAGGQISHSEFRAEGAAPPPSSEHSHGTHEEPASAPKHEEHKSEQASPEPDERHSPATNAAHEHHAETNQPQPASASTNATHEHAYPTSTTTNAPTSPTPAETREHAHEQPRAQTRTNAPSASGEWLPDTPEAIWAEIHRRHHRLAEAIKANDTGQIHANAVAIEKLGNALIAIVHPDHKAVVQKGTEQIIAAVRGVHGSAHADDPATVESNFKLFERSLNELEQQMKKQ